MNVRRCKECTAEFAGRSDKIFCTDGCRNSYNNRRNAPATRRVRQINSVLYRNRRILLNTLSAAEGVVPKEELQILGVDFSYFTQVQFSDSHLPVFYCYDIGYQIVDDAVVRVL